MREKRGTDNKGRAILGKSKGYGFVEFSSHEQALKTLNKLNNNQNIFTDNRVRNIFGLIVFLETNC